MLDEKERAECIEEARVCETAANANERGRNCAEYRKR